MFSTNRKLALIDLIVEDWRAAIYLLFNKIDNIEFGLSRKN